MFNKKGENEAKAVGVLIILIALMMTLYLIFIPPEDREQLLKSNNSTGVYNTNSVDKLELLSESPGIVTPEKQQKADHNLIPVNLFIKNEPTSLSLAQSLSISQGLFSKSFPTLFFNVNKKDLKKVTLFFSIAKASGELRISVNKNQFYSETISSGVKIINIPLEFLVEKNNEVTFSVSGPGFAFWKTNEYSLSDVGVKQEFELINSKEERKFTILKLEKDSLEAVKLSYFQVCNLKLAKPSVPLKVYVNKNSVPVLSTRIWCTSTQQSVDLDINDLLAGQNTITFVLEEGGDFTFNEVKLTTQAKQTDYPEYSFGISKDQYESIKSGSKRLQIELYLENNKKSKAARITVNAGDIFMQEKTSTFVYNLKDYVEQGSNFIRITPNNEFLINGLKITLQ